MRKEITDSTQRRIGIILQYGQMGLSTVISLIYTPIMLRILGKSEYGIYNLAASIIAYLNLLTMGFGVSYIKFYSSYQKESDRESLKKMNGLYLIVFSVMGVIALIGGMILAANAGLFYNDTYSIEDIRIARVLMAFMAANLAISFPASVFVSYISAHQKFVFQKIVNMGNTIISPTVNIILLKCGFGSVGLVATSTFLSLIVICINVYYCFAKLNMEISIKTPDFHLLKDIFSFSVFIAINQLIDQINWQTDKVILGKIVNSGAVAVYAVGSHVNTLFTSMSTAISGVFAPQVNMMVQENDKNVDKLLTELFIKVGRIQWFVLSLVLSGFVFFGRYFIFRWAGGEYSTAYWIALLLMAPATIPLIQNVGIEIQRAKNKHQFRSLVYLGMAVINVVVSVFLAQKWQEIGVTIGTTVSLLLANGLIMNVYYKKCLGIDIKGFWKSIVSTIPSMLIPLLLGSVLMVHYEFHSLVDFCVLILVYSLVFAVSVFFWGMNSRERKMMINIFRKIRGTY